MTTSARPILAADNIVYLGGGLLPPSSQAADHPPGSAAFPMARFFSRALVDLDGGAEGVGGKGLQPVAGTGVGKGGRHPRRRGVPVRDGYHR